MNIAATCVPASTSNLGPGYDSLGLALDLHNTVQLTRLPADEPSPEHPEIVADVARRFFEHPAAASAKGAASFAFEWSISGDVPRSRGLGSSVTVRQGVLQCLNQLCGHPLNQEQLFQICAAAEGHPDNAGPAAFGGFFVASESGTWLRFSVPESLRFVLLIPAYEVLTEPAREVLPDAIPHQDAVRNTANACLLTAAMATAQLHRLRDAFRDYLHQDYRAHLVPGLADVVRAGEEAGALGGFLSGSGSTMACLATEDMDCERIAAAMRAAHVGHGEDRTLVVGPDNHGAQALATGSDSRRAT